MAIDDTLRAFMDKLKMPEFSGMDWAGSTEGLRQSFYRASRSVERDLPDLAEISNLVVDGADGPLKARLYIPLAAGIGPAPAIVTAHEDALAAWTWATERGDILGLDPDRIAVAGDSAGGNLSAYIAQETSRSDGIMPAFQLLLYPLVQFADIRAKKMTFQEGGFFLSPNLFDYFRDSYIAKDTERMDKRVSPLFADDDDFAGLPPAHMVLCGWDPLKDEGRAYASKLAAHGVPVTIKEHPGMVHGFMNMTAVSNPARQAIQDAGEVVGKALGALD